MKEKILEALSELGFVYNDINGSGYQFSYEGKNMLYMYNKNDENFLCISAPCIAEIEEGKEILSFALMDNINSNIKYIKSNLVEKEIWLFYELALFGNEDICAILSHMILHLDACVSYAKNALSNLLESFSKEDDDNDNDHNSESEEITAEEIDNNED
ncbi:MAG: hypothetical protein ACI308_11490 [Muribaculaceae bacterium]